MLLNLWIVQNMSHILTENIWVDSSFFIRFAMFTWCDDTGENDICSIFSSRNGQHCSLTIRFILVSTHINLIAVSTISYSSTWIRLFPCYCIQLLCQTTYYTRYGCLCVFENFAVLCIYRWSKEFLASWLDSWSEWACRLWLFYWLKCLCSDQFKFGHLECYESVNTKQEIQFKLTKL